jgi:PKD repeat protein
VQLGPSIGITWRRCGARAWLAALAMLVAAGTLAAGARAEVVRLPGGRALGVLPIAGASPASLPGSEARPAGLTGLSATGDLDYHGGPVLHASAPYLIFWDPSGEISAGERSLLEQYFHDTAADSGSSTNVFGVDRQFTDSTGFANYSQSWAPSHVIDDTQPYPTSGNCTEAPAYSETVCLYDGQLEAEISRLIAADSLPTGITGAAPIYFVVTPPDVDSCFDSPYQTTCADNAFCAYHSGYVDGGSGTVLYADIPTVLAVNDPKSCQYDGYGAVQSPNASATADVTIKYMSHEFNESITDPLGDAWWDANSGNEDGDNCNFYGSADPSGGSSPDAFVPALGGSAVTGTLYDQVIDGDHYYTQSEWSNGDVGCEMRPSNGAITAAFSPPPAAAPGASVSFDPSASSSTGGWTSATWSWGDGGSSFAAISSAPGAQSHTFTAPGSYTVSLTLVDAHGDISTVSHQLTVGYATAAFSTSPASVLPGATVSFDASGSSSTAGSIQSYHWVFGDGTSDTTSSPSDSHAYAAPGSYTVRLTVTDSGSHTAQVSHSVTVLARPVASIRVGATRVLAGAQVSFDGSASSSPGSSISSYSWSFGDGTTGTGERPAHAYARPGRFTVQLTVTDATGASATSTQTVEVVAASIGSVRVHAGARVERLTVALTGAGTLRAGDRRVTVRAAGTVRLALALSTAQRARLLRAHHLRLQITLTFTPTVGPRTTRRYSVTLSLR